MGIFSKTSIVVSSQDTGLPSPSEDKVIGNYSIPSAQVASSEGGIETPFDIDGTEYADQAAYDAAWVSTSTANIRGNPTTDLIDQVIASDGGSNQIVYDLGQALSDISWEFKFSLKIVAKATNPDVAIILSDTSAASMAAAQDHIGMRLSNVNFSDTYAIDGDAASPYPTTDSNVADVSWAVGNTRYVTIKRTSATTYTIQVFTDAARTIQEGTTLNGTCAATVTGLRYIKIGERLVNNTSTCTLEWDNFSGDFNEADSKPASNAIDNNTNTFYMSAAEANPNIYIDCDGIGNLNLIGIAIYFDSNNTETQVKIQTSTDAAAWTDVGTIDSFKTDGYSYIRFNGKVARYIRIYGNSGTALKLGIKEIKYKADASFPSDHLHNDISSSVLNAGLST